MSRDIFKNNKNTRTAWASGSNFTAGKGRGDLDKRQLKLATAETGTVLDVKETGIINRIWMTFNFPDLNDFPNEERNNSLIINFFWDDSDTPAISAPFGDFFGHIMGKDIPFHNEFFADSTGRAYICFIPMPFKKAARITVTNNFHEPVIIYHEINLSIVDEWDEDNLYLHAYSHREEVTKLGEGFDVLPKIKGSGRFLGSHVGVRTNPLINSRWADMAVRFFLDGDTSNPSLIAGAVEDYYGSAWGWDTCFCHPHTGRLLRDVKEGTEIGAHSFYRYHIKDPIYFKEDCRVNMIQGTGLVMKNFKSMLKETPEVMNHIKTIKSSEELEKMNDWELVLFEKSDDWSAVAFFYLDKPNLLDI